MRLLLPIGAIAVLALVSLIWYRIKGLRPRRPNRVKEASIQVIDRDGSEHPAFIRYELREWVGGSFRRTECALTLTTLDRTYYAKKNNVFLAFLDVRTKLEGDGLMALCYGAAPNITLSGLGLDWGGGEIVHKIGLKATDYEDVYIFDSDPDVEPVSVAEQKQNWGWDD